MFRRSTIIEYNKTVQVDMKIETIEMSVQANNERECIRLFERAKMLIS